MTLSYLSDTFTTPSVANLSPFLTHRLEHTVSAWGYEASLCNAVILPSHDTMRKSNQLHSQVSTQCGLDSSGSAFSANTKARPHHCYSHHHCRASESYNTTSGCDIWCILNNIQACRYVVIFDKLWWLNTVLFDKFEVEISVAFTFQPG